MAKQYTKKQLIAWADAHFPKVRESADDIVLERELREKCVGTPRGLGSHLKSAGGGHHIDTQPSA